MLPILCTHKKITKWIGHVYVIPKLFIQD